MMDFKQKWDDCLALIKTDIGVDLFDCFFRSAHAVAFDGRELTLRLKSSFLAEEYEGRFFEPLSRAMNKVFGPGVGLSYTFPIVGGDDSTNVTVSPESRVQSPEFRVQSLESGLNPELTLDNYCVGQCNREPVFVARYIAEHPEKSDFNPFFLYGQVGVGKTHLIQGIGLKLRERMPSLRVLYMPYRQFEHDFTRHTIRGQVPDFIEKYESIDVLLLDDVQEISGKTGTMNVLYPIFNHLQQRGRKLIFTADRAPEQMQGVTDRLIDRFRWGVVKELQKPDFELCREILRFKAGRGGLELSDEVIDVIAANSGGSVRELEGTVLSLMTRSIVTGRPMTKELAMEVMHPVASAPVRKGRAINFDMIVETTADYYHLNTDVIFSKSRVRDINDARQLIMYLCSKHTRLSKKGIGMKLGRVHGTVLHAIDAVTGRLPYDKDLQRAITSIESQLQRL